MSGFDHLIAVDGSSGSGKTSLLRALRARYDCLSLEVGPVVRAIAWWSEAHQVSTPDGVAAFADARRRGLAQIGAPTGSPLAASEVTLGGVSVLERAFAGRLGPAIAATSVDPAAMIWIHQLIRAEVFGRRAALSGRRTADEICPEAGLKIRLDAAPHVRAARKARQLLAVGARPIWHDDTELLRPLGAQVLVDTTSLSIDQTVDHIARLVERQLNWRPATAPRLVASDGAPLVEAA